MGSLAYTGVCNGLCVCIFRTFERERSEGGNISISGYIYDVNLIDDGRA